MNDNNSVYKSKAFAVALWFIGLLGYLNIHNFYLKRNCYGIIKTGLLCYFFIALPIDIITRNSIFASGFAVVIMVLFIWNVIELISIMKLKPYTEK